MTTPSLYEAEKILHTLKRRYPYDHDITEALLHVKGSRASFEQDVISSIHHDFTTSFRKLLLFFGVGALCIAGFLILITLITGWLS